VTTNKLIPPLPHALRSYEVHDGIEQRTYAVRLGEAFRQEDGGPPLTLVRADVLAPLLVYLNKLFMKMERTERDQISRFTDPEDFTLTMRTRGFTPEDFNALMSLAKSMGAEYKELLDSVADKTPQMSRTSEEERKKLATGHTHTQWGTIAHATAGEEDDGR